MPQVYIVMASDYEDVFAESAWTTYDAAKNHANERNERARARQSGRYYSDPHDYRVVQLNIQGDERSAVARD